MDSNEATSNGLLQKNVAESGSLLQNLADENKCSCVCVIQGEISLLSKWSRGTSRIQLIHSGGKEDLVGFEILSRGGLSKLVDL